MTTKKRPALINKGGRPQAISPDAKTIKIVHGLGEIQATTRECAAVLGVSHQTFIATMQRHPEIAEALERGKENGKVSLRRKQWRLADKNAGMAIFLGKNILDQTDKQEIASSVSVDVTVTDARTKLEHHLDRLIAAGHGAGGPARAN